MISRESIQKIMDHVRIEDVIGDFVSLKRAGSNLKGNCPFHDEKTPSFVVSPAKNIYKCFGCGAAGDSVKFMMEHEQLNYPEALRYLAEKYRIEIEEIDNQENEEQKAQQSVKESLWIAMKYAADFYHNQLIHSDEGKSIGLSYFKKRGFSPKTIEDFKLGYAPDGFNALLKQAQNDGYQLDILEKCGLVKIKEERGAYDFFRARVMFPIHNVSGKVVAFGGRVMGSAPQQAKYINTPETEIYTKGKLVYGIFQAKNEIRKSDQCYLVEGYTDVLGLYQAGITNVVASSGTALTKEQVRLIRRYSQHIILIYDGDKAGIKAAIRGIDILLEEDMDVKVVVLPEGEDPDSFVRNQGTDATLAYIEKSKKDFIFFKADILLKDVQNDDPHQKSQAIRQIVESIALIKDPIRKAFYTRECSKISELPEEILIKEVNKALIQIQKQRKQLNDAGVAVAQELLNKDATVSEVLVSEEPSKSLIYLQEKEVLRVLFAHGHRVMMPDNKFAAEYILDKMHGVVFQNTLYQKIYDRYVQLFDSGVAFDQIQDELSNTDPEMNNFIIDLNVSPYQLSPNWEEQHHIIVKDEDRIWENDIHSALNRYTYHKILDELKKIDVEIKNVSDDDFESLEKLLEKKMNLQQFKEEIARTQGTVIFK